MYSRSIIASIAFLTSGTRGWNRALSWSIVSATNCWCFSVLRDFMILRGGQVGQSQQPREMTSNRGVHGPDDGGLDQQLAVLVDVLAVRKTKSAAPSRIIPPKDPERTFMTSALSCFCSALTGMFNGTRIFLLLNPRFNSYISPSLSSSTRCFTSNASTGFNDSAFRPVPVSRSAYDRASDPDELNCKRTQAWYVDTTKKYFCGVYSVRSLSARVRVSQSTLSV